MQFQLIPLLTAMPDSLSLQRVESFGKIDFERLVTQWGEKLINFGIKVVIALVVFYIGKLIANLIAKGIVNMMKKRNVDPAVISFLHSFMNITILVVMILIAISILGVQSVSFAALLASAGVAIGMGLSGQLQNLAGGIIILLSKPFKIGDHIQTGSIEGTVDAVKIFHTVIRTFSNQIVYVPNGKLTSNEVTNYECEEYLRNSWTIGIEYDEDFEKVKAVLMELLEADPRILKEPKPYVVLHELADSSVNVMVRAYSKPSDLWGVYWDFNKKVYEEFNKRGIGFPFPQLTVHKSND